MGTIKRCHADADAITAHWLSLQLYSVEGGRVHREALLNNRFCHRFDDDARLHFEYVNFNLTD